MAEYIVWDITNPGISFNLKTGRIRIFKQTLVALEYPEYYRFLFSPEDCVFGIEPCGIDDKGANRLPDELPHEYYEIKSVNLVRFVYKTCGWQKKMTYRIAGEKFAPDSGMVVFNLRKAYEIHEGRMGAGTIVANQGNSQGDKPDAV